MSDQEDTLLESMKDAIAEETKAEQPAEKPEEEQEKNETETVEEPKDEEGDENTDEDKAEEETAKAEDVSEQPDEQPKRRPSASDTIRALKEERKAIKAELEQIRQDRAAKAAQQEFEQRRQQDAYAEQSRKAREEKLALLDPQERALYLTQERMAELEYRLNISEMQRQQDADRAKFEAKAATDPLYAKYGPEVEKLYQEGIKRGVTAPREELLNLVLGRALRNEAAAKITKKKEAAGKRIDAVTSKPASARGDVSASRKGQTEEDRLRGVLI